MGILHPHLQLYPAETAWSYASRLAALHTGGTLASFLVDLGILMRDLRAGEAGAVSRLAEVAGLDSEALARTAIRSSNGRFLTLRNETFTPQFISPREARVCPSCLADDEAEDLNLPPGASWKQRIAWRLRPVAACPAHGVGLVDLAPDVPFRNMPEFGHLMAMAGGVRRLVERAEPSAPGLLQLWVHDRLDGRADDGGPWLEGQTIEQGACACEVLGAELLFGREQSLKSFKALSQEQWKVAGASGLEVARGGAEAVRTALDVIRARRAGSAVQAGPEKTYGLLYTWLHFRSPFLDPGPIRHELREHILDHLAIEPGETVLGEVVAERRMHSERSLAQALKLTRGETCRGLVRVGLMPPGLPAVAAARLAFQAREVERLCAAVEGAVTVGAAANLLGCTKAQVEGLCEAGVLAPFVDHGLMGATRRVVLPADELADLLARLKRMAARADAASGTLEAEAAARLAGVPYGRLVALVLEGRLGQPCWLGLRSGLSALGVRESAAHAFMSSRPEDLLVPT